MITAVDSSVAIDVLIDDPSHAETSLSALGQARREGAIIICEIALAEIAPLLEKDDLETFLTEWEITFTASSKESAVLAGRMFKQYLKMGGKQGRVLADFLIGAHARIFADRLLTRDRGYYREYFKKLSIWSPGPPRNAPPR